MNTDGACLTIVDGILVPDSAEDAKKWEQRKAEVEALRASDPEKYKNYRWQIVPFSSSTP